MCRCVRPHGAITAQQATVRGGRECGHGGRALGGQRTLSCLMVPRICVVAASPCSIALFAQDRERHVPVEVVHDMSGPTMIEHEDADERVAEEAIVALTSWPTRGATILR